ncbi:hypothetical protein Tco_0365429 [Tanacetum coccineum]
MSYLSASITARFIEKGQKDKDKDEHLPLDQTRVEEEKDIARIAESTKVRKTKIKVCSSKGAKSQSKSYGKSVHAKEPEFEVSDSDVPHDQEEESGTANVHRNHGYSKESRTSSAGSQNLLEEDQHNQAVNTRLWHQEKGPIHSISDHQGFIYVDNQGSTGIGKSENKGKVTTEMELVLEQTQQGTSHEVSISTEGIEELERKVKIKGEKKEALLTPRQKPDYETNKMWIANVEIMVFELILLQMENHKVVLGRMERVLQLQRKVPKVGMMLYRRKRRTWNVNVGCEEDGEIDINVLYEMAVFWGKVFVGYILLTSLHAPWSW